LYICKLNKEGFIISSTHPFLGASPDGVVLEGYLVEVKRTFPGTMTLKEAMCSQGICKKTGNGLIVNQNHANVVVESKENHGTWFKLSANPKLTILHNYFGFLYDSINLSLNYSN